jgi:hypothetical protein
LEIPKSRIPELVEICRSKKMIWVEMPLEVQAVFPFFEAFDMSSVSDTDIVSLQRFCSELRDAAASGGFLDVRYEITDQALAARLSASIKTFQDKHCAMDGSDEDIDEQLHQDTLAMWNQGPQLLSPEQRALALEAQRVAEEANRRNAERRKRSNQAKNQRLRESVPEDKRAVHAVTKDMLREKRTGKTIEEDQLWLQRKAAREQGLRGRDLGEMAPAAAPKVETIEETDRKGNRIIRLASESVDLFKKLEKVDARKSAPQAQIANRAGKISLTLADLASFTNNKGAAAVPITDDGPRAVLNPFAVGEARYQPRPERRGGHHRRRDDENGDRPSHRGSNEGRRDDRYDGKDERGNRGVDRQDKDRHDKGSYDRETSEERAARAAAKEERDAKQKSIFEQKWTRGGIAADDVFTRSSSQASSQAFPSQFSKGESKGKQAAPSPPPFPSPAKPSTNFQKQPDKVVQQKARPVLPSKTEEPDNDGYTTVRARQRSGLSQKKQVEESFFVPEEEPEQGPEKKPEKSVHEQSTRHQQQGGSRGSSFGFPEDFAETGDSSSEFVEIRRSKTRNILDAPVVSMGWRKAAITGIAKQQEIIDEAESETYVPVTHPVLLSGAMSARGASWR